MKTKQKTLIRRTVYSAMFLAIALVLPFITGQIPAISKVINPMHIPVLLCGLVCGPVWGAAVGFTAPILRSMLFGMPLMFPMAVSMAFELLGYGLVSGLLCKLLPRSVKIYYYYVSLVAAMIAGRLIYCAVMLIIAGISPDVTFSFAMFWTGTVVGALPGIAIHIVIIPPIAMLLEKTVQDR